MFFGYLFIFAVCVVYLPGFQAVDVPSFIHVCAKDTPDMKACLIHAVEEIRPYLKSGYPEYNIPSVEPIYIKELIKEEASGLKIETTDVVAYGGGDFIVKDVLSAMENHKIEIDVLIPTLSITAKYSLDGKLVMVPIRGNGDFSANLTDCRTLTTLTSETYEKDGEEYFRFISCDLKVKVGGGTIHLDNLFGGDKTLSGVINDTINKNLAPFIKEILPYIEKALGANFLQTGNQIIAPYTMKQLFP